MSTKDRLSHVLFCVSNHIISMRFPSIFGSTQVAEFAKTNSYVSPHGLRNFEYFVHDRLLAGGLNCW